MKKFRGILLLTMVMAALAGCGENAAEIQQQEMTEQKGTEETSSESDTVTEGTGELTAPQGEMIKEQTFEVELDAWGKVTFASFAPENTSFQADGLNPDIRFYLMDGATVLYEFPGWNEEHTNADLFLAVSAVAFKDYNEDGLLDVITLCEYETMSGEGFQTGRIYFQKENRQGFEEDTLLTEYLSKNYRTDSIAAILEAKEEYWDYKASMDGHRSVYAQSQLMAENKNLWLDSLDYADEVYQYAVTDLDHNGRQEIIVSQMGGTGSYTYSRFFQVNDSYDGLEECETDFVEGDSQPDLMTDEWVAYMDAEGIFHYVVQDFLKVGAAEYHENVRALSLREGKVFSQPIARRSTIYTEGVPKVTCEDAEGNVISEAQYETAARDYFAGYEESVMRLGWQGCRELPEAAEGIVALLQDSYDLYVENFD